MCADHWAADEWVRDRVAERSEPTPTGDRGIKSPVWVGIGELLRDARTGPYTREQVTDAVEECAGDEIYYWRGLLAPATTEYLAAIIENERLCDRPNEELLAAAETFKQELTDEGASTATAASGGGSS